ncbi:MAG: hypothetical protein AAFX01_09510 [Cyanobacteria bacterium J06638_28]
MKNTNLPNFLHRISKACPYSSQVFGLTLLGLMLVGVGAAKASLIGDDVRLDLDFQGDSLGEPASGILPGPVVEVEEDGVFLIDGVLTPPADFDVEFLAGTGATSEDGLSSAVGELFLNLEADLMEGFVSARWDLRDDDVTPLRWEYTLSDLDWADFPAGRITDIQFSFIEGIANGTVTGCVGQSVEDCKSDNGGVSASVASGERVF